MRKFLYTAFFIMFGGNLWAFYPEADGYKYEKRNFDVYVGVGVGTVVSDTFGSYDSGHYKPLYLPTQLLKTGSATGFIGFRFFDKADTFVNDFRIETEWQYIYNWYTVLLDSTVVLSSLDTSKFPSKGQEVLKNAMGVNLYYDFRFISPLVYPYIGAGLGMGEVKYLFVDTKALPNSMGEQYHGSKNVPYYQLMLGVEVSSKVVKSSFYVQYKMVKALSSVTITPFNPGDNNFQNPETELPAGYTPPTPRDVTFFSHGIGIGAKYYLR